MNAVTTENQTLLKKANLSGDKVKYEGKGWDENKREKGTHTHKHTIIKQAAPPVTQCLTADLWALQYNTTAQDRHVDAKVNQRDIFL